jgi:hypothetical protein
MRSCVRSKKVFENEIGRISGCNGLDIKVRFDLVETQDFVDGVPSLIFRYGNFRYAEEHISQVHSNLLCGALLKLRGRGIEVSISLNNPDKFTVINVQSKPGI